jgi:SAM-dependent methyltransferase
MTTVNASYTQIRGDLLALVAGERPTQVLDVGCANGATGAALKERYPGCHVTGIELDPRLAEEARGRLDCVLPMDAVECLERLSADARSFDLVLCGDVLEHLVDPWRALRLIHSITRGRAIISLPNVAHWSTLWSLLVHRRWPYRERGIHDRTHLRFFAAANLPELFAGAGFIEAERRHQYRLIEAPHPMNQKLAPALARLPIIKGLTCFQFLSVLRPA